MASDEETKMKSAHKKDKKEKKEKKRSETNGVSKPKKDKKEKKADKEKLKNKIVAVLDTQLQADAAASAMDEDVEDDHPGSDFEDIKNAKVKTQLVFFAKPLADEKGHKKIYKTIKKARKAGALQRGVKEVNKALRKTPLKTPSTANAFPGIAIIAGDISPDEVIMHLPIYCEEHNVPYLFVQSRLELGTAAKTKRPTSVVFLTEKGKESKAANAKKAATDAAEKDDDDDNADDYVEAYKELLKLAQKEFTKQMKDVLKG